MALEQFANTPTPGSPSTAWTTLSSGINDSTTTIPVVSALGFPSSARYRIRIEDELLIVTAGAGTTSWTATRGAEGTTAAAHSAGVGIYGVLTAGALGAERSMLSLSLRATPTEAEAGSLLHLQNAGAATAVNTSATCPLLVTRAGGQSNFASLLQTAFSTDVGDGLMFSQSSTGVAQIQNGMGSLATSNKGQRIYMDHANRLIRVFPETNTAFLQLGPSTAVSGHGSGLSQLPMNLVARNAGDSNYFNSSMRQSVWDGTNIASAFELGVEGNWTNAGGFTENRVYLWDFQTGPVGGKTIFFYQKTTPHIFNIGSTGTDNQVDLQVLQGRLLNDGFTINTDVDGTIASGRFRTTFTKNDTNTRTFPVVKIQPTFNFGGSNTTTTVNLLDIDSTNTAVTGLTANLFKAAYGGSTKFNLDSSGNILAGGATETGVGVLHVLATSSTPFAVTRISSDVNGGGLAMRKARGSLGSEAVINSGDNMLNVTGAGYDAASGGQAFPATVGVQIRGVATQTWSTTAHGSKLDLRTTTNDATATATRLTLEESGHMIIPELTTNPTTTHLTSGAAMAVYLKNDNLTFAFNDGGTLRYLFIPLTGTGTTWSHDTTGP